MTIDGVGSLSVIVPVPVAVVMSAVAGGCGLREVDGERLVRLVEQVAGHRDRDGLAHRAGQRERRGARRRRVVGGRRGGAVCRRPVDRDVVLRAGVADRERQVGGAGVALREADVVDREVGDRARRTRTARSRARSGRLLRALRSRTGPRPVARIFPCGPSGGNPALSRTGRVMAAEGYFSLLQREYFAGAKPLAWTGWRVDQPPEDDPLVFFAARFSLIVFCGFFFWSRPPVPAPRSFDFAIARPPRRQSLLVGASGSSFGTRVQRILHQGGQQLLDRQVAFLDVRGDGARHADGRVGERGQHAARLAGQRDHAAGRTLARVRRPGSRSRSCRSSRSRSATSPCLPSDSTWRSNIPSAPKSFAIAVRSDVSVVSAIAGIDGRRIVGRERADELRRQVLGVGGAAAVAADQDLAAARGATPPGSRRRTRCRPGMPPRRARTVSAVVRR